MAASASVSRFRRPDRHHPGALSVALLGATLGLTALLAYQAVDSARSHRQTAEHTLRDYAGIAAWEFARRSRDLISSATHAMLGVAHEFDRRRAGSPMPEPTVLLTSLETGGVTARAVFSLELSAGTIHIVTPTGEPVIATWLQDSIVSHDPAAMYGRRNWRMFTVAPDDSGSSEMVAYHLVGDRRGRALAVIGFIADAEQLVGPVLLSCSREGLLPEALARDQSTDSLLSLRVVGPRGEQLFATPIAYDTSYAASDTLGSRYGDLRVQAAVRPDAASTFIIGGLPRSRLPLLLALMFLTLGVGVALLVQMRRERQLALLRDDFVSGVSHELRTPLTQIRMFGELLDQGKLRSVKERRRSTAVINREARRLSHLVENLLLFSRLRRNNTNLTFEQTNLSEVIHETLEAFTPLADARSVELRERIETDLEVPADRDALSRILLNLLDNAVKYGPTDQTVTVALEHADGTARIVVEDMGPGIPIESRAEIWGAYRRLQRDANTTTVGSGIGLSVVAELAELHGGRAWVEDVLGGGARFVVSLPGADSHRAVASGA